MNLLNRFTPGRFQRGTNERPNARTESERTAERETERPNERAEPERTTERLTEGPTPQGPTPEGADAKGADAQPEGMNLSDRQTPWCSPGG